MKVSEKIIRWMLVVLVVSLAAFAYHPLHGNQHRADGLRTGVVWFGVLRDGLALAETTGKPILLLSAAPNCAGVSGMW